MSTLLVGGLSSVHDPLCAAALRGIGLDAVPLAARTDAGLRRARGLGNHGQCNPAHYAVGAVLEHAQQSGQAPADFARRHEWLTIGSCGPCRLASFGFEYARVLDGAGLGALPLRSVEQLAFVPGETGEAGAVEGRAADALLRAVVAGDVLSALGHRLRPWAVTPAEVDALVVAGRDAVAEAFATNDEPWPALLTVGLAAEALAVDLGRALPRVLLVGEPWTTLADGDPSYDLARRLEVYGAEVDAPRAVEWLRYRLWEEIRDARRFGPPDAVAARVATLHGADRRLRALWRQYTVAVGVPVGPLAEPDVLALAASPHYDVDVRGGSAHLEVGRALVAVRDRTAHLVLSLKPFGCLPSSALSDGVLGVRLRESGDVGFLAVETTGDADAAVESRLEMTLHAAALCAAADFDSACLEQSLTPDAARARLSAMPVAATAIDGERDYACTAAELILRQPPRV